MSVALLLAQPRNEEFQLNDETVSPGYLGFAVFLALCAAVYLLIRSMNKQMNKIQVPREADLVQQEWEREQAAASDDEDGEAGRERGTAKAESADRAPKD
ncbi:hypothetical protein [Thermomonospora cellulosilytica]|uniref:Uncharacterized protein n=1 Tax=Thermomonospora cellulosilytica TaxID=1411118 RepID=A0A7W3MXB2_9ACTN|nr:hypothetical protein [Thermomonospora cellulosilytica]MBA9003620.1 hypothetical protein [Thermomonospora cellulosilytica]